MLGNFALDQENVSRYLQEILSKFTYKNQRQGRDQKGRLDSKLLNFRLIAKCSLWKSSLMCLESRREFETLHCYLYQELGLVISSFLGKLTAFPPASNSFWKEQMNHCGYQIQLQAMKSSFIISHCYNQA